MGLKVLGVFVGVLMAGVGWSADAVRIEGSRAIAPPTLDGVVEALEWAQASKFEGMIDNSRREPAPEKAEFWITYDNEFVYFAARLEDKEPSKITATERQNNTYFERDDAVTLYLSVGGYQGSYESFTFNALGTTALNLAGGRTPKVEWLGEFQAKARITDSGWEGEARIPWQLLNLGSYIPGDIRLDVSRHMPRRTVGYTFARNDASRPQDAPIWVVADAPKLKFQSDLKLLPYAYLGYDPDRGHLANAGLDFKTELPGRINAIGTINPDFRNIEQSVLPLSFSRFELLADETRPFFLEGAQYVMSDIFASQRIGDVDFGLNLNGALSSKTNFGLLNTLDFGRTLASAGQVTHRLSEKFTAFTAFTALETPDSHNHAASGSLTFGDGPYTASLSGARSWDAGFGQGDQWFANAGYYSERIALYLTYSSIQAAFLPGLGYAPETDVKGWSGFTYFNQPLKSGPVDRWTVSAGASDFRRQNGDFYSRSANASLTTSLRNHVSLSLSGYASEFLGDHDRSVSYSIRYPNVPGPFSVSFSQTNARFAGEPYKSTSIGASYRLGEKYSLGLNHQNQSYFGTRDQFLATLTCKLGVHEEIAARLVSRPESTNWYLTFRRSGNRGAEYFVIFGDPSAEKFRPSFVIKGVFPVSIR